MSGLRELLQDKLRLAEKLRRALLLVGSPRSAVALVFLSELFEGRPASEFYPVVNGVHHPFLSRLAERPEVEVPRDESVDEIWCMIRSLSKKHGIQDIGDLLPVIALMVLAKRAVGDEYLKHLLRNGWLSLSEEEEQVLLQLKSLADELYEILISR